MGINWADFLAPYDRRLLRYPSGRRAIAARSPMLFALIYLRHHLSDDKGNITVSPVHVEWAELAKGLMTPTGLREFRHTFAAPRSAAKTTWWFHIIPIWLGCFGYRKFAAAFADSAQLAQRHLLTFKSELDTNELLRADFPDMCQPARKLNGTLEADRVNLYIAKNRFAFSALGADSKLLGMKIGSTRPDYLLLDDVEGDESTYSIDKSDKRLRTIRDAILPLNERAGVVLTGTVTMADSIVHQTVKAVRNNDEGTAEWIKDEKFECHHYLPIAIDDFGTESSIWPEKWPLGYLKSIAHTRSYAKNFANEPMAEDGKYWLPEHFRYGRLDVTNIVLLSIDPHVKRKKTSDFTGLSVVRYSTPYDMFDVAYSLETRARGKDLRKLALQLVEKYDVTAILIETNQGQDLWTDEDHVFDPKAFPCKITTVDQGESKEIRAARAVAEYENERVLHWQRIPALETQMLAFPHVKHDDMVDSVTSAIIAIRKRVGAAKKIIHNPAVTARWRVGAE